MWWGQQADKHALPSSIGQEFIPHLDEEVGDVIMLGSRVVHIKVYQALVVDR